MGAKTLVIKKLVRFPKTVDEDEISFDPGANVLVGEKDTGKTMWLRMLDFVLGKSKTAEKALGKILAEKYDSISALVGFDDKDILIERKWKESGLSSKIIVDGQPMNTNEFSEEILTKLNIPILHFPKGNPYTERAWPQLGFRTLLRHIYRRETMWDDFADSQYESEQHAALSLFVGIADKLFPDEYGKLVSNQKKVNTLEEMKDQFVEMLQEVSKDLVVSKDLSVAITPESVETAKSKLRDKIDELHLKRTNILEELKEKVILESEASEQKIETDIVNAMSKQLVANRIELEDNSINLSNVRKRLNELKEYLEIIQNEENKLKRVQGVGNILAPLKATHCPVCDSAVNHEHSNHEICYLCKKQVTTNEKAIDAGVARIDFDLKQLQVECLELKQLILELENEEKERVTKIRNLETEIQRLKNSLKSINIAVAAILPPDIGLIEQKIGGLEEQILQLDRISGAFKKRSDIASQIFKIEQTISSLQSDMQKLRGEIDYQTISDTITDGMNSYLNALNANDNERWTKGKVSLKIKERNFDAFVSDSLWSSALGAASRAIFLLSYHYSLLSLSCNEQYFYPGLSILDFPVQLADKTSIADKENYLVEPFINLCAKENFKNAQFIAAGRAFKGLNDINRVELNHTWK